MNEVSRAREVSELVAAIIRAEGIDEVFIGGDIPKRYWALERLSLQRSWDFGDLVLDHLPRQWNAYHLGGSDEVGQHMRRFIVLERVQTSRKRLHLRWRDVENYRALSDGLSVYENDT